MTTFQENNNFKDTFEADESKIISPNQKILEINEDFHQSETSISLTAKHHIYKIEKKIGELRYSLHEIFNLSGHVKKDIGRQNEHFTEEITNLNTTVKKDIKEIESRCRVIKEIDKKFTEDCNKTVVNLTKEYENIKKVNEELSQRINKCEIDFGSKNRQESHLI